MRNLSADLKQSIDDFASFTYCFEVKLLNGKTLYLTSSSSRIRSSGINQDYRPNSGLTLAEACFNDSAQNYIILKGIFENDGILKVYDLTDATVKILIYTDEFLHHLVTYYCTSYSKYDLDFKMYLEPETVKYRKLALNVFSKTCRASFGDQKCKADKSLYSSIYTISSIVGKTIVITNPDKDNGYYDGGEAVFGKDEFLVKILKHDQAHFQLDKAIPDNVTEEFQEVTFVASCDKKFETCCNKFSNNINFRGEPFVPDDNFLNKNSPIMERMPNMEGFYAARRTMV